MCTGYHNSLYISKRDIGVKSLLSDLSTLGNAFLGLRREDGCFIGGFLGATEVGDETLIMQENSNNSQVNDLDPVLLGADPIPIRFRLRA